MKNLITFFALFCVLWETLAEDKLIYESGFRQDGDELVFLQYKTSPRFPSPQDYDLTIFFDGQGNTTELTRKEVWSVTADKKDLTIEEQKNYFKVRVDKKSTRHLNCTVKVYGLKLKEPSKSSDDDHTSSAQNFEVSWANSLILLMAFCIHRIFF